MPIILYMLLHFEVNGEEVLQKLGSRWFFHAQNLRHSRLGDKLDERGTTIPVSLDHSASVW